MSTRWTCWLLALAVSACGTTGLEGFPCDSEGRCPGAFVCEPFPRSAEYKHGNIQEALQWMHDSLGSTHSPEWTFSLSAQ